MTTTWSQTKSSAPAGLFWRIAYRNVEARKVQGAARRTVGAGDRSGWKPSRGHDTRRSAANGQLANTGPRGGLADGGAPGGSCDGFRQVLVRTEQEGARGEAEAEADSGQRSKV